ncbi:MAG: hypothetical protein IK145_01230 [Bacteroidales bacterium]|nr:hypothetical protein [Bacteroidales bacterium]
MSNKIYELFVEKDKPNKGDSLDGYSTLFLLQALAESRVNGMLVNNDKSARVFLLNGALYDVKGILVRTQDVVKEEDKSFMGALEKCFEENEIFRTNILAEELASRGFNGELKDDSLENIEWVAIHILIEGNVITLEHALARTYIAGKSILQQIVFNGNYPEVYYRDNDVTTEELDQDGTE